MFECEVCGRLTNKVVKRRIEGAVVSVCPICARYGGGVSSLNVRKKERAQRVRRSYVRVRKRRERLTRDLYERYEVIEDFNHIIRRRREELGMKQKDLAEKLGIKESMLQKIEAGKFTPDIPTCMKIEAVLGIRILKEAAEEAFPFRIEGKIETGPTIGEIIEIKRGKPRKTG